MVRDAAGDCSSMLQRLKMAEVEPSSPRRIAVKAAENAGSAAGAVAVVAVVGPPLPPHAQTRLVASKRGPGGSGPSRTADHSMRKGWTPITFTSRMGAAGNKAPSGGFT